MPYPSEFLDEIRARVSLESVISRKVKLTKRGREFTGLCPFHNEKTPSFTVAEEKGFYHCFGCGAHGDVIRFVMDEGGLRFHEAVEKLAAEAGLPLPEFSKEELEAEKKKTSLFDVMEKASNWFISRLAADEGKAARDYLKKRGLSDNTIQRFSLGFAPARKTALKEALLSRGVKQEDLIATGLLIEPEDKGEPFDRFRNRLMFPILDFRGRTIAFGGRALDDAPAKYLNSPETALFHKGRVLYNQAGARKAAMDMGQVIAVEGYMDVIALTETGFDNVVAPLGTAITENQLALLWRMAPEPVLCFDGDAAGQKAAARALERALPLLKPGHSLRFVMLPEGDDPDTLVRREGKESFQALVDKSLSLANLMWRNLTQKAPIETPEQRAGLEKKVFDTLNSIQNEKIRGYYRSDFGKRLNQLFRAASTKGRTKPLSGRFNKRVAPQKSQNLLKTQIGRASENEPVVGRLEELILLTVINHPQLAHDYFEDLSSLHLQSPDLESLQKTLLQFGHDEEELTFEKCRDHLLKSGYETLYMRLSEKSAARNVKFAQATTPYELAEKWWHKTIEQLHQISNLKKDYKDLEKDYLETQDEKTWKRLTSLREEINRITQSEEFLREYDLDSGTNTII